MDLFPQITYKITKQKGNSQVEPPDLHQEAISQLGDSKSETKQSTGVLGSSVGTDQSGATRVDSVRWGTNAEGSKQREESHVGISVSA